MYLMSDIQIFYHINHSRKKFRRVVANSKAVVAVSCIWPGFIATVKIPRFRVFSFQSVSAFGTMTGPWMLFVSAAEVQHVQFGSTVTLSCNISYLYDTTWLKNNPDLAPTVVLSASLKEGRPAQSRI